MSQQEQEINRVFAYYFKQEPLLAKYATCGLEALKNGDVCVEIDTEDKPLLLTSGQVSSHEEDLTKPFVLSGDKFYFQRYLSYENKIVEAIERLNKVAESDFENRKATLLSKKAILIDLFKGFKQDADLPANENIDWQLVAVLVSFLTNFSIVTGGPGTGKTTTVSKLLGLLFSDNPNLKVALAAQTGKAAARLKESLDNSKSQLNLDDSILQKFDEITPSTLHRLLGYKHNSVDFKHNQTNPLPYDVVILDESSMIDLPMMAKVFEAIGSETKLLLLGDKNQLASVDVGSVFGDLCDSVGVEANSFSSDYHAFIYDFLEDDKFSAFVSESKGLTNNITELKRSYRFSSVEGLGVFANKVLQGESILLSDYSTVPKSQGVCSLGNLALVQVKKSILGWKDYISEEDVSEALKKFTLFRILATTKEGNTGVVALNALAEKILTDENLITISGLFYEHQPIMITKNDYSLGLYNGDIGLVRKNEVGELQVYFEDSEKGMKVVNPSFLKQYETCFAMTIHKSQGSEFKDVLLVLPERKEAVSLNRQLIYTGITRAKEKVFLVGSQEVFDVALETQLVRNSNLKNRFL